jgi:hypothetical protein
MRVEYNTDKVHDMSYPLILYELCYVHSPVVPGLTTIARGGSGRGGFARSGSPLRRGDSGKSSPTSPMSSPEPMPSLGLHPFMLEM